MPPLEAWQKVLVAPAFLADTTHGTLSCTRCHGGVGGKRSKEDAHAGMVADPARGNGKGGAGGTCATGGCHTLADGRHAASIHGTQQGFMTSLAAREGGAAPSQNMMDMHHAACASCHTTCGQCHISRPDSAKGGFVAGHVIRKRPNPVLNCMACHGSRIGEEFRGQHDGLDADVHYGKQMNCSDCHTRAELHGDGSTPSHRYDVANAPRCLDCHPGVASSAINDNSRGQHAGHVGKVACQVCHSLPYKNCYGCHVGKKKRGLVTPSELDFRIGRNPLRSPTRPWDWVVLRHVPIRPYSFDEWGVTLKTFDAAPTWRYATPHNIRRKTPQNADCKACHGNDDLFLTPEAMKALVDRGLMVAAELPANAGVVVKKLPKLNK